MLTDMGILSTGDKRRLAFRPASPIELSGGRSLLTENYKNLKSNADRPKIKSSPRRRDAQRIILDSYICDRTSKHPVQYVKVFPSQNLVIIDSDRSENNDVEENTAVENVNPAIGKESLQENTEVILSGDLSREQLVTALDNGLLEEQQFYISEGTEHKQFWMCSMINCGQYYHDRSALHVHILSHFNFEPINCNHAGCSEQFVSEVKLNQHKAEAHNTEAQRKQLELRNRQILDEALESIGFRKDQFVSVDNPEGGYKWSCPQAGCKLSFKALYLLKNHLLRHYDVRPYKCTHKGCKWAFRSYYKLKCHLVVHDSVRQYVCDHPGCGKSFTTKFNFMKHKCMHAKSAVQCNKCPATHCDQSFKVRSHLENHISKDHTARDAPHECGSCGKKFWWIVALRSHKRVHAQSIGEPVCPWPGCGRRFTQACRLRYHLRSHTGDRPYRCTFPSCNWAFESSGKLRRHAQAHVGDAERRHVCETCGSAFYRFQHLNEHLSRHKDNRSYECDYPGCGQKFSNKSTVYAHKKRDHGIVQESESKAKHEMSVLNPSSSFEMCGDDLLSFGERIHVPWVSDNTCESTSIILEESGLLQHHGCDKKQGNPLVCGGIISESDGPSVNSGFMLDDVGGTSLSDLDLLETSGDHMNSLLQEELSDAILYSADDDSAMNMLLSNGDS